jgi:MFS family permease
VVAGLLSGAFALGGGLGPLLGGLLADWLGFKWGAAVLGALLAATAAAVCVVHACSARSSAPAPPSLDVPERQLHHHVPGVRSDMLRTPAVPPMSPRSSGGFARAFSERASQPIREPLLQPRPAGDEA